MAVELVSTESMVKDVYLTFPSNILKVLTCGKEKDLQDYLFWNSELDMLSKTLLVIKLELTIPS